MSVQTIDDEVEATQQCPHCMHSGRIKGAVPQWHLRKGPAPALDKICRAEWERTGNSPGYHRTFFGYGELWLPRWVDHAYRFRLESGNWCYVAEPYDLHGDDFSDFIALESAGFRVKISAEWARHYPGRTLAVLITNLRLH